MENIEDDYDDEEDEEDESTKSRKYHCLVCCDVYMNFEEITAHIRKHHFREFMREVEMLQKKTEVIRPNKDIKSQDLMQKSTNKPSLTFGMLFGKKQPSIEKPKASVGSFEGSKMLQLKNLITCDIMKIYEKDEDSFRAKIPTAVPAQRTLNFAESPRVDPMIRTNKESYTIGGNYEDSLGGSMHAGYAESMGGYYTPSPGMSPCGYPESPSQTRSQTNLAWSGNPPSCFSPSATPVRQSTSHYNQNLQKCNVASAIRPMKRKYDQLGISTSSDNLAKEFMKRKFEHLGPNAGPSQGPTPGMNSCMSQNMSPCRSPSVDNFGFRTLQNGYQQLGLSPCQQESQRNANGYTVSFSPSTGDVGKDYANRLQNYNLSSGVYDNRSQMAHREQQSNIGVPLFAPPKRVTDKDNTRSRLEAIFGDPRRIPVDPYFKYLWEITSDKKDFEKWDPENITDISRTHCWAGEHVRCVYRENSFLPHDYPFEHYLCRKEKKDKRYGR